VAARGPLERCDAHEHRWLERLCRDITHPALAHDRVQRNTAGQVVLRLDTPWRQGSTCLGVVTLWRAA